MVVEEAEAKCRRNGKDRSRLKAFKHGQSSFWPVLPGESEDEYSARYASWMDRMHPIGAIENWLAGRVVQLSWEIDRLDRSKRARMAIKIERASSREVSFEEEDEVLELGWQLFWDPRGPVALYPWIHPPDMYVPHLPRPEHLDSPDEPARLVKMLEQSVTGCEWLLSRWRELRNLLEPGLGWQSPDKFKAIRLLGKQPLDAADDSRVRAIFLLSHVVAPQRDHAFRELDTDLVDHDKKAYTRRLETCSVKVDCSVDEAIDACASWSTRSPMGSRCGWTV